MADCNSFKLPSRQPLILVCRVVVEEIGREPLNWVVRARAGELCHALQQDWHDGLVQIASHREHFEVRSAG